MNWKQILQRELEIWCEGYPSQRKLLRKFAEKIKLEIELQGREMNNNYSQESSRGEKLDAMPDYETPNEVRGE